MPAAAPSVTRKPALPRSSASLIPMPQLPCRFSPRAVSSAMFSSTSSASVIPAAGSAKTRGEKPASAQNASSYSGSL